MDKESKLVDVSLFEEVEGFCMLKKSIEDFVGNTITMKEHIESIKALKIRDDDVILCTYAKSGTHWVWEILSMLISGTREIRKETKVSAFLELQPVECVDKLPSPRILNTHLPPHLLPVGIIESKCKVVHVRRNPKDVTISAHQHYSKAAKLIGVPEAAVTLEDFQKRFMGKAHPYNFFKYLVEFEEYFSEHELVVPAIHLTYEDLKRSPVEHVARLAKFLNKDYSEEQIAEVVAVCSFNKMKHAEENIKDDYTGKTLPSGESVIFRKGEVGDWKNHFTVAWSERYDSVIDKFFGHTDIRFQYE